VEDEVVMKIGNRNQVTPVPSITLGEFNALVTAGGGDPEDLLAKAAASTASTMKAAQVEAEAASTAITDADAAYEAAVLREKEARDDKKRAQGEKLSAARLNWSRAAALNTILSNLGKATQS